MIAFSWWFAHFIIYYFKTHRWFHRHTFKYILNIEIFVFKSYKLINLPFLYIISFQIFHTIAIILLIISTLILSIGVIQQILSYSQTILKYELSFVIVSIVVSVSWLKLYSFIHCITLTLTLRVTVRDADIKSHTERDEL